MLLNAECLPHKAKMKYMGVQRPHPSKRKSPRLSTRVKFLLQAEALVEAIDTSTGVNQLLLAGIERVALGADLNTDLLLGGASGKGVAAGATDRSLLVLGVDTISHFVHLFLIM